MKAILFAAGLGTRLQPFTNHKPKALVEVNNKTLLERNIRYLQHFGVNDVIVNVHHFAAMIEDTIKKNKGFGSNISISDEREAVLETGGGLKKAASFFAGDDTFVVMNADVLTNLDLGKMIAAHRRAKGIATLAVMQRASTRQLLFDNHMHLTGWVNNSTREERIARTANPANSFAFSGIHVVSHTLLHEIRFEGKFSLIDVYLDLAKTHLISGYDHTGGLFIDVGKPESIEAAENLFP